MFEAAKRELKEETGLEGTPKLVRVMHLLTNEGDNTLDDKVMFLCLVVDPIGQLTQSDEGQYYWVKESELDTKLTKPFESKQAVLEGLNCLLNFNGIVEFFEAKFDSEGKF